jgi:hypothetical protein
MLGVYKFDLDNSSLQEKANRTEIEVYFNVDVSFDKNVREVTYSIDDNDGFLMCSIYIGGVIIVDDFPFKDLAKSSQDYIKATVKKLDLADFGIDEDDVQQELEFQTEQVD